MADHLKQAFEEGRRHGEEGGSAADCPIPLRLTDRRAAWLDGFDEGSRTVRKPLRFSKS